jgi:hypothetical protein
VSGTLDQKVMGGLDRRVLFRNRSRSTGDSTYLE